MDLRTKFCARQGNGWAAAGMPRVLATIMRSKFANSMLQQQVDLTNWVKEIHSGIYPYLVILYPFTFICPKNLLTLILLLQDDTNLFRNYPDNSSDFYDASSTALLASTVYRLSVLVGDNTYIAQAEASRKTLSWSNSTANGSMGTQHITPDGWLTPVVDPLQFDIEGSMSPEGQAFVLEMEAAWRDWVAAGPKVSGAQGLVAGTHRMEVGMILLMAVVVGAVVMLT
jgi:hypothetical protein